METTLYYFFSTLAQSFAALVAFVYVAAQTRIAWLDAKVTSSKMVLLYKIHAGSNNIDYYMAINSATDVAKDAASRNTPEFKKLSTDLSVHVSRIQELRNHIREHVKWGFLTVVVGLLGIALTPFIVKCSAVSYILLALGSIFSVFSASRMGKFVIESLNVSLKNDNDVVS